MRAARIRAFGGPEVIRIEDTPVPRPGAGQLLVRVRASSVNPVDYKIRQGGFLPKEKLPIALGRDVSGTVEAVGEGAQGFGLGEGVFAMLGMDQGGNAEFVVTEAANCAPKPGPLDHTQAGSVGLAALTAWQGLFDQGALQRGQNVLIHGGAGGVGHFAVQFARVAGARVFATADKDDVEFVRRLGASEVIDYKSERFETRARDIDVVLDLVGGETQTRSWSVVRRGGIVVSTLTEPDKNEASRHGARGVHYMAKPDGAQLRRIGNHLTSGEVVTTITRTLSLNDLAEAHRSLEQDNPRGKIAITVANA